MRELLCAALLLLLSRPGLAQHTILWKVTRPGSSTVSYLLGTYHSLGESFVDSLPVIKEKLLASDRVITETEIERSKMAAWYNARPGSDTLAKMVSTENLRLINEVIGGGKVDIFKYTPGELWVKLNLAYIQYKCNPGGVGDKWEFDEYLQHLALQHGRQQVFLERTTMQTELISRLSGYIDWKYFKKHIPAVLDRYRDDRALASACSDLRDYMRFDIDYGFHKKCMDVRLVKERNDEWMKTLPGLLDRYSCFVAVGLHHLRTRCGIIAQLRGLGYTVEPVEMR